MTVSRPSWPTTRLGKPQASPRIISPAPFAEAAVAGLDDQLDARPSDRVDGARGKDQGGPQALVEERDARLLHADVGSQGRPLDRPPAAIRAIAGTIGARIRKSVQ